MEVYILRHGIAENRRQAMTDAQRRLTEEGRRKLRLVLQRAVPAKVAPSSILTSPLVRAVQTAEVASQVLGFRGEIEQTDVLLPTSSCQAVWRDLRRRSDEKAILLVGHEPLLSETASYLVSAPRVAFDLKKGSLLRIDIDDQRSEPQGVIQWLLVPKLVVAEAE